MTRNHPQLFRAAGVACLALLLLAAAWLAPSARSAGAAPAPQATGSIFVRKLALKANDVVHSPSTGQLYASVPSSEGAAGNSVAVIDPATGAVSSSVFIGSEPNRLALADDGTTLYASLDGAYAIRRFDIQTQTPGTQFAVGADNFFGPLVVNDLAVAPGEPHVVAVARYYRSLSPPEAGVAVFDNGVRRTKTGPGHSDGADFLAYSASASKLYGGGYSYGLRTMNIDSQGVTVEPGFTTFSVGARIKFDNGLVYSSTGQVINPVAKTLLGTFAGANTLAFVPDSANGRAYYLVRDNFGSGPLTLKAFDINTFLLVGSQTLPGVVGTPTTLVRWGTNGLAFRTDAGELHVVQTTLIPSAAPVPTPTPSPTPTPTATPLAAFVRQLPLQANDLVYHSPTQRLYASVPSAAGAGGNSITPIDPVTGAVGTSVFVGSEPSQMALADDGQTMYVGLNGAASVRRFDLATQTAGAQFNLGVGGYNGPSVASDIAVMPGTPGTVAVSRSNNGVAVFDDGVARAQPANASGPVEFGAAATRLYVGNSPVQKFSVGASGLTADGSVQNGGFGGATYFDRNTGLLFSTSGQVIEPEAGVVRGTFTGVGFGASMAVDSAAGRVYFLVDNSYFGGSGWSLRSYDINTFRPIAFTNLGSLNAGTPTSLVRWGTNGLAFRTANGFSGGGTRVYLVETALVSETEPIPAPTPAPSPTPTPTPAYFPTFVRSVNLPTNDLVYNEATASLYASVPSPAGSRGNSITPIDPATGTVGTSVFIGSEPTELALADDGRTLYVNLDGAQAVRRYDIQTQTPGIQFSVGALRPADMEVVPGSPQSLAVSRGVGSSVAVFDDGVQRPNTSSGGAYAVLPIEFGATPSVLYGYDSYSSGFELVKFNVSASGVTGVNTTYYLLSGYSTDIKFAGGRLYSSSGQVVDPEANTLLGTFTNGFGTAFAVDRALGRIFFLTGDSSNNGKVLRAFDINTFLPLGAVTLPGVTGTPTSLVRWGTNGLAFRTANGSSGTNESRVYVIQSHLVSAAAPVPTGLQLLSGATSVTESVTNLPITVSRSGDVSAATTVDYATGGGTAAAGEDYTATAGTLAFAPGESSKNISVPILNDNVYEGNETFNLTLSNPSAAAFTGPSSVTVTILDNESRPYVLSQNAQVVEGNSGTTDLRFNVTLSNASVEIVAVNYATSDETASAGSDYVATSGTITFLPGSSSAAVLVPVKGDTVIEPNETFRLNFSVPVNSSLLTGGVVGQITNDDSPGALRFSANSYNASEGDGGVTVTVVRVSAASGVVSVNYATGGGTATAGQDYTATAGTLTFGDGETSKSFTVPLADDTKDEADETVNLTLSAPAGGAVLTAPSVAVLTIEGRDSAAVQFGSANYSVSEGAGKVIVGVTRTGGDPSAPVSVAYATGDGNAKDTSDYNLTLGTLNFAAGETEKSIVVLITNDVSAEAPETFVVGLSAPSGAALGTPAATTVTINSDDAAPAPNPVGDGFNAEFFVRQHYHDFFSREPDAEGLAFWTNQITECESRPEADRAACREARRINVSAAFFLSIEFQGTGYFVYRVHQAALNSGEGLRLRTFAADAQAVGRGVTVGVGNWQQVLEANKQAFVNQFVARPEFVSAYQGMSNAQFVDALNANTLDPLAPGLGGALSPGERDQLVDDLNASRRTRAGALYFVAEHQEFQRRRVNPSFVLMQYFGYLRRNPNETPDVNFDGYNFWLAKLNNHGGNFVAAEMVKAFITSGEYLGRFEQ